MKTEQDKLQWEMCIRVFHGPRYGHRVDAAWGRPQEEGKYEKLAAWTGTGIPDGLERGVAAVVSAIVENHLTMRYGLRDRLPGTWEAEPDPF